MARSGRDMGLALGGASALTLLAVLFLDRPAAIFAHARFHDVRAFVLLTHLADPVLPLALIGFLVVGVGWLAGWRSPPWVDVAFGLCVATLLTSVAKDQLKYLFGRTWPETWVASNPSLIGDGVMAFAPFHGGAGWASFPSGHTALATAPMAALILASRTAWRWLCLLPAGLVAVGLYGADYHYVGDILGGATVGTLCAAIAVRSMAPPPPRTRP